MSDNRMFIEWQIYYVPMDFYTSLWTGGVYVGKHYSFPVPLLSDGLLVYQEAGIEKEAQDGKED